MELLKAREIAVETCYRLNAYCDRLHIAGSIRRKVSNVKDIEIVCEPKTYEEKDLFGTVTDVKRSQEFMNEILNLGKVVKGKPSGRMVQIELQEIMLDLFIPEPHDYFRQFAIRTGSAQYSSMVIAYSWKQKGWCGTENGLRKIYQCTEKRLPDGKSKWICVVDNPELPPVWENEVEFFNWIGVPYKVPPQRFM